MIAINNLIEEDWLDHNTRAVLITFTVRSAYTNAFYIPTILVETPGNFIFQTSLKLQTTFITVGEDTRETSEAEVFSIIVDALLVANVFIFAAKSLVELSIGVNKITNIVEGVNLTFLLFATFMGFTLKGLTVIQNYEWFNS